MKLEFSKLTAERVPEMRRLWDYCFPGDSEDFKGWYFDTYYDFNDNFIATLDGKIIASAIAKPAILQLGSANVQVNYVQGVNAHPAYRSCNAARQLIDYMHHETAEAMPIAILKPFNPSYYRSIGYTNVVYKRVFKTETQNLRTFAKKIDMDFILMDKIDGVDINLLLQAYNTHTELCDSYTCYDEASLNEKIREHLSEDGKILAMMQENTCIGYYTYYLSEGKIEVNELIYNNLDTARALLYSIYQHRSQAPNLELELIDTALNKILISSDNLKPTNIIYTMAQIIDIKTLLKKFTFNDSIVLNFHFEGKNYNFNNLYGASIINEVTNPMPMEITNQALTSLVFGIDNAHTLARAGLITGANEEQIANLNQMFPTGDFHFNQLI